jgi:hypothetical protein
MILRKFRHRRAGYPCSSLTNGLLQHRTIFVAPQRAEVEAGRVHDRETAAVQLAANLDATTAEIERQTAAHAAVVAHVRSFLRMVDGSRIIREANIKAE